VIVDFLDPDRLVNYPILNYWCFAWLYLYTSAACQWMLLVRIRMKLIMPQATVWS